MTSGDQGELFTPGIAAAAMVGAPLIGFGAVVASLTVRSTDWAVPLAISSGIALLGVIRSLIWITHARRLKLYFGAGWVCVVRGGRVIVHASAGQISGVEWVTPALSVLFTPNSSVSALILRVEDDPTELDLWMPFEPQIRNLERVWRKHGLPG